MERLDKLLSLHNICSRRQADVYKRQALPIPFFIAFPQPRKQLVEPVIIIDPLISAQGHAESGVNKARAAIRRPAHKRADILFRIL